MPKTLVFGTPEGGEPCLLNVGLMSPSDLPSLAQNVGSWGISGLQFRAAGCLLLAEAVEKVPGVRFLETLIQCPGRF